MSERLGSNLDSENLQAVPLEENPHEEKRRKMFLYWIDNAFPEQVIPVFAFALVAVLVVPITWYAISKNKSNVFSQLVPVTFTEKYDSVNVDLSFDRLGSYKKFISIDVCFVRASETGKVEFDVEFMYEAKQLKRLKKVRSEVKNVSAKLEFAEGQKESQPVSLLFMPTNGSYDVLDVLATIRSTFTGISDVKVVWATANEKTYQILTSGIVILLGATAVCFHSYCITFRYFLYIENIMTFPLIGLAIAGVNPLIYLFEIDIRYISLFIVMFSVYCKYHMLYKMNELEMKRSMWLQNAAVLVYFAVYLAVSMAASGVREDREILEMKPSVFEYIGILMDLAYIAFFIPAVKRARQNDEGSHPLRTNSLIGMGVLLIVADIVANILAVVGIAQGTVYSDMLRATAAYSYVCIFSMLFKRRLDRYGINPFNPSYNINLVGEEEMEMDNTLLDAEQTGTLFEE